MTDRPMTKRIRKCDRAEGNCVWEILLGCRCMSCGDFVCKTCGYETYYTKDDDKEFPD